MASISTLPTYSIKDVEYDRYKDQYVLVIDRGNGSFLTIHEPATHGIPTARHRHLDAPEEETKESPHDEEIVEAGIEFLMKVTEEAVLDAMVAANPFIVDDRECYRNDAQDIVHKRLTAFVNGEEVTDPRREADPDGLEALRAAHGIPSPAFPGARTARVPSTPAPSASSVVTYDEYSSVVRYSPPKIDPCNRYYSPALVSDWIDEEEQKGVAEYLDATKGPSS